MVVLHESYTTDQSNFLILQKRLFLSPSHHAMAKRSKLLAALDAHKGIEHSKERQKQLQKQAEKRKKQKDTLVHGVSDAASEAKAVPLGNGIHVTTKVSDDREVDIDGIVGSSLVCSRPRILHAKWLMA